MKRDRFETGKWMPIFIFAVALMIVFMALNNLPNITAAIAQFLQVISPLLYGILFTYFLYTPHHLLEKLLKKVRSNFISKRARGISTIIMFLLLLCLIVVILSFVIPIVFDSVLDLANALPAYVNTIADFFENMSDDSLWNDLNLTGYISDFSSVIVNTILNAEGLGQVADAVVNFTGGVFSVIMGLIISLYILHDRERIADFFKRLNRALFTKNNREEIVSKYLKQINKVLFTFIASKGLDSIINLTVAAVVLFIFQVPYALLLALIAGVFNFIPYLGSIISAFIISAITLIAIDWQTASLVLLCLLIFNQLDGNYIEPRIMKSSLKISPILVIISVVAGGAYFGIIGMFLAVPFAVIVKQILLEFIASREQTEQINGSASATDTNIDCNDNTITADTGESITDK